MVTKKTGGAFGRDEMNLLVGGVSETAGLGTAGAALTRGFTANNNTSKKQKGPVDIASLSTAETAALLQQQQQGKHQTTATAQRHRAQTKTKKRMQHHELLEQELLARQQQQQQQQQQREREQLPPAAGNNVDDPAESDNEEEDHFAARSGKSKRQRRIQLEPQIVQTTTDRRRRRRRRSESSSEEDVKDEDEKEKPQQEKQQRRKRRDSSSSESDDGRQQRQRRKRSLSSSSSSSSEDERRQRRLKNRQQLDAQVEKGIVPPKVEPANSNLEWSKAEEKTTSVEEPPKKSPNNISAPASSNKDKPRKRSRADSSSSSSESSSSGSSDGSSSDSGSSSSLEEETATPAIAKPLFVPKHKRLQLAQEQAQHEKEEQERLAKAKQEEKQRAMESRALVAQVVATTNTVDDHATSEDEDALAQRQLKDDDDNLTDEQRDQERDAWEVRELERLLTELDRLQKIEQQAAEYRRRQQLTDAQAEAEDKASGRYQQPGSSRMAPSKDDGGKKQVLQKYFHRGAYYMDQDEWTADDVRHKAKDYEHALTASQQTQHDVRNLPQVMQVKQFGRANRSKYKGLREEDTSTAQSATVLPLVQGKRGSNHNKKDHKDRGDTR